MDCILLKDIIYKSGLKKKAIAQRLGITPYTFQLKIENKRIFNIEEVSKLCSILNIDANLRDEIFFNFDVENNSTKFRKED